MTKLAGKRQHIRDMMRKGMTYDCIGAALGCTGSAIWAFAARHRIKRIRRRKRGVFEQHKKRITTLWKQGVPAADITKKFRYRPYWLYNLIRQGKLPKRRRSGSKSQCGTKERAAIIKLRMQGLPALQIAGRLNISYVTVSKILHEPQRSLETSAAHHAPATEQAHRPESLE